MVFSSLLFIFQFIPAFFILYYVIPKQFQNLLLLIASLFFYGWGEPRFILLIFISILLNYIIGKGIAACKKRTIKKDFLLVLSLIYNIGTLVFFKYTDFFIENINGIFSFDLPKLNIPLPLGISFYTFQIMSYTIDVYQGKVKAEKSILSLGTYLCMFPQLIAGPIVVYTQVCKELKERTIGLKNLEDGLKTFVLGLGSKVLIANNIGALWNDLGKIGYSNLSTPLAWMGILAFTLQIYFDFNGYSLMAIGLGKMLGFQFPKNFDFPYISKSITEFWRRWHITLSSWFREYLYIPLGGNRKGRFRTYLNLFIVWTITGLWHGASWNFIFWGLYFFFFLMLEKIFLKKLLEKSMIFSRIYTIIVILISWMIFAITDVKDIFVYFKRLIFFSLSNDWIYYLQNYGILFLIGIVLSTPILKKWYESQKEKPIGIILLTIIFILCIAYLVDASYNPFLYFRF